MIEIGTTFGRWTVISTAPPKVYRSKSRCVVSRHLCICQCGKQRIVTDTSLRTGRSTSCGCARIEKCTIHGHYSGNKASPEYVSWRKMKDRCSNKKHPFYSRYGGRGISVCDRWLESFSNFLADMGCRPSAAHSLDRIDNNGPYCPTNCRWSTRTQQHRNKSNNVLFRLRGKYALDKGQ